MCFLQSTVEFFNNATVGSLIGAFIGAAGAVGVVIYTDLRRERIRASVSLPALLRDLDALARIRRERVRRILGDLLTGPLATSPYDVGMPFDTTSLRWMTQQAFDRFSPRQRRALANLVFMLEEADNEMRRQITQVASVGPGPAFTRGAVEPARLEEILLERAQSIFAAYLAGELSEHGGSKPAAPGK